LIFRFGVGVVGSPALCGYDRFCTRRNVARVEAGLYRLVCQQG